MYVHCHRNIILRQHLHVICFFDDFHTFLDNLFSICYTQNKHLKERYKNVYCQNETPVFSLIQIN